MKFNEKLVRLRKIKGITQDEFATAVGVSRQAVYKWESGQSYPEVSKLLEIKLLFGISIDDLLDESFEIALPEKKRRKRAPKAEKIVEVKAEAKEEKTTEPAEDTVVKEEEATPVAEAEPVKEEAVAEVAAEPVKEEAAKAPEVKEEQSAAELHEALEEDEDDEDKEIFKAESEAKKRGFFGRLFGRR